MLTQPIQSNASGHPAHSAASRLPERSPLAAPRAASAIEQKYVISPLVLAFSKDPVARWLFPDPHQYLSYFPQFVAAFASPAFERDTAYVSGDYTGVALWYSPGVETDAEAVVELLQKALFIADQPDVFAVFEQMGDCHPRAPHWYLPVLGVDPRYQGQGYGSALLQTALDQCDRDRLPAYLESSKPENVCFYQRHGFEVVGTIQAGKSPEIFSMLRQPKRHSNS